MRGLLNRALLRRAAANLQEAADDAYQRAIHAARVDARGETPTRYGVILPRCQKGVPAYERYVQLATVAERVRRLADGEVVS